MSDDLGFVGLGTMGARMATRLLDAGNTLVVQTRTAAHAEPLAALGAAVAATPAEVTERCAFVFSCLLDSAAVESVYLGPDGLLGNARNGQVFVEHGTFAPSMARRLADAAAERGAAFVDAPVTGGPEGAAAGTLITMVGGDEDAVAAVEPLLRTLAREVVRIGGPGTGLELKLVNQLLVAIHVVAAAEAAAFVERLQLPAEVAERVLTSGWGTSSMLSRSFPRIVHRNFDDSGTPIGGLYPVLRLVDDLSREAGLSLRLFPVALEVFGRAGEAGLGHLDMAAVADLFDSARAAAGVQTANLDTGGTR